MFVLRGIKLLKTELDTKFKKWVHVYKGAKDLRSAT
jgi:hypothetical protein